MTITQYERRLNLIVGKNVYILRQIYDKDFYKHIGDRFEFLRREYLQEHSKDKDDDNVRI